MTETPVDTRELDQIGRKIAPLRLEIARVTCPRLITAIARHPRVFPWISDDQHSNRYQWQPPMSSEIIWLLAFNPKPIDWGVFPVGWGAFFPRNGVTFETHFAFLPDVYGSLARQAFADMIQWVRQHTNFRKLIGEIPRSNRLALKFARRAGFRAYAVNKQSIERGGKLEDQICFELSL